MGIGDWGLGIGPIPNPQSPIQEAIYKIIIKYLFLLLSYNIKIYYILK